ncbi:MAG: adenylate/guanylate cyclase domain-containing protein [Afipia sp.]|nr:adenylate/guanylate cyclase domain-containing protein [Afipia sp.]
MADSQLANGLNSDTPVSDAYRHALIRETLQTELLRVKALIIAAALLGSVAWVTFLIAPQVLNRIWEGTLKPIYLFSIIVPFFLFEIAVYALIKRQLALGRDLPVWRRYLNALIETSVPTCMLAVQMGNMGGERALGFIVPLIYLMFVIVSTLRLDFWLSVFTGFVAATELFLMAMYYLPVSAFDPAPSAGYHGARSLIILACGVLAGAVGSQLRRQFEKSIVAASARDRVTNLFGQHVSPQVAERLLTEGASAASDHRQVAVMFVDFRSFTSAARTRTPQQVVERLDGAFADLVEILDRHHGIVNKFLGDGFLALFGAPLDDPRAVHHAVAAAREMLNAMERNNKTNDWQLRIGIGLHFGAVVAGNIGSPRRKEYTVMGDTVNFASRIEALNKDFNSQFLISSAVRDALGEEGGDAVLLGEVPVKGYEQPMAIWRLA